MSQTKQACKCKKSKKVLSVSVLGVAGMSLAATGAEAAVLSPVTALQPMPFSEEEISDVSLATFHLYDKDKGAASSALIQVGHHLAMAAVAGCRGCGRGWAAVDVGRGCGGGWGGGCGCGGCGWCLSWGGCRPWC